MSATHPPEARAAHGSFRPLLHASMGLFAFALGVLPRWGAVAAALLAVLGNWVLLPRLALERRLRRPGEPFVGGLRTYPVAVLLLVALLPAAEAAAAWAVLAFGDAAAALVGQAWSTPALLGHPKATGSGSGALLGVGTLSSWGVGHAVQALGARCAWVETGGAPTLAACAAAALAATLIDLVRVPPDDNLPCAAAAGATLWAVRSLL